MSYDLMVFDPDAAPADRESFMAWYDRQTEWREEHSYDDPVVSTPCLRSWFLEIAELYPPMNGPLASDDVDSPKVTDYSVGTVVVYAAFAWSVAEAVHAVMFELAKKHRVGFYDLTSDTVWKPTHDDGYERVYGPAA